jgi:hypothetical protein
MSGTTTTLNTTSAKIMPKYRMSKQQFDAAVDALRRGEHPKTYEEAPEELRRVYIAACVVMRQRLGIPDDQPWSGSGPTDVELALFFAGLDEAQRKRLKRVAEGFVLEKQPLH